MGADLTPDDSGAGLHGQVGILGERVSGIEKNLGGQIGGLLVQITAALAEMRASDATVGALDVVKVDVATVGKQVDGISSSIGWAVKIVPGMVLAGLVGLLFAKGAVPHP